MRVLGSLLIAALALCNHGQVQAAHVKTGKPEHIVARGGECVRLFHSQGSIGCRGLSNADMSVLRALETQADVDAWVDEVKGNADGEKRALVLPEYLLTKELIDATESRIAGVFAYPNFSKNVSFASTMPQGDGSPDAQFNPFSSAKVRWNSQGRGLMDDAHPFPVVLLDTPDLGAAFLDRAKMNDEKGVGASYTAFMKYYYGPESMDSLKCLAFHNIQNTWSPKCDPIGGQSVWGTRGNEAANETIMVMTGMDAYAFSQILAPGANEGASGVVALLAAAKALQSIPDTEFAKKIVFAAFQAEKFGFVGSRRFLADIREAEKNPSFCKTTIKDSSSPLGSTFCSSPLHPNLEYTKLNLSSIAYAIAIDQVGLLPTAKSNFSLHLNPNGPKAATAALVDAIVGAPSAKSKFSTSNVTTSLPPTPLLSFVNDGEFGRRDLVSAVVAGYDANFTGEGVYASRHDEVWNIDASAIAQVAQVIAETVYTLGATNASKTGLDSIRVDKDLIQEMVTCISSNWTCTFMKNYSKTFVATMVDYGDLVPEAWPLWQEPATLYPSTFDTNRQPLVITVMKDADDLLAIDFPDASKWTDSIHRVKLFPNAYEVFVESFLATALADKNATTTKECAKTQDCDKGFECVFGGVCVKQRAHFHDAYSPGLNRSGVGLYTVLNESMSLWTEPVWASDIGSYVFPNPGEVIGWVALLIGVVVAGVSVWVSRWILQSVQKMKLL